LIYKNIDETKADVLKEIKNPSLTYEQIVSRLAKIAENQLPYPEGVGDEYFELFEKDMPHLLPDIYCQIMKNF